MFSSFCSLFILISLQIIIAMQNHYVISFKRSGGFTGITLQTQIESNQLPEGDKQKLDSLIIRSGVLEYSGDNSPVATYGSDQFQYEITIETGNNKHTVLVAEPSVPTYMRPLIRHLVQKARFNR